MGRGRGEGGGGEGGGRSSDAVAEDALRRGRVTRDRNEPAWVCRGLGTTALGRGDTQFLQAPKQRPARLLKDQQWDRAGRNAEDLGSGVDPEVRVVARVSGLEPGHATGRMSRRLTDLTQVWSAGLRQVRPPVRETPG